MYMINYFISSDISHLFEDLKSGVIYPPLFYSSVSHLVKVRQKDGLMGVLTLGSLSSYNSSGTHYLNSRIFCKISAMQSRWEVTENDLKLWDGLVNTTNSPRNLSWHQGIVVVIADIVVGIVSRAESMLTTYVLQRVKLKKNFESGQNLIRLTRFKFEKWGSPTETSEHCG